jgi:hypothetical protein
VLSGPKINYWNVTPTLFLIWLWIISAVSKNTCKICLKGTKISGYWRH